MSYREEAQDIYNRHEFENSITYNYNLKLCNVSVFVVQLELKFIKHLLHSRHHSKFLT